jgi:hypothetical protein
MSKKTSKTKARKATKRAADQTPESADSAAKTPIASKLIPELAAMKLSPKIASKLEALSETLQDTVLNYVNSGMKVNDAYQRTIAGKSEQDPQADSASPAAEAAVPQADSAGQTAESAAPAPTAGSEPTPTTETTQAGEPAHAPAAKKPTRAPKAKKETGPKKLSAIDAAAKVLAEAGEPMDCQTMIKTMAEKGYWTSPGGKTPAATLYSAILRELQTKGNDSRFKKTERGKFGVGKAP